MSLLRRFFYSRLAAAGTSPQGLAATAVVSLPHRCYHTHLERFNFDSFLTSPPASWLQLTHIVAPLVRLIPPLISLLDLPLRSVSSCLLSTGSSSVSPLCRFFYSRLLCHMYISPRFGHHCLRLTTTSMLPLTSWNVQFWCFYYTADVVWLPLLLSLALLHLGYNSLIFFLLATDA